MNDYMNHEKKTAQCLVNSIVDMKKSHSQGFDTPSTLSHLVKMY